MDTEIEFIIAVAGIPVLVHYHPKYLNNGYDHFEFQSTQKPRKGIPISDTGYRSHFAPEAEVKSYGSPQEYAEQFCDWFLSHNVRHQKMSDAQLTLF